MYSLASIGSNSIITAGSNLQTASNGELRVNGNVRFTGTLFQGNNVFTSGGGVAVSNVITNSGHLVPASNDTFDLGSTTQRWRNLYLSGNAISFGNGVVIDSFNWNYMVNYVIPPKELANTSPRILQSALDLINQHQQSLRGVALHLLKIGQLLQYQQAAPIL